MDLSGHGFRFSTRQHSFVHQVDHELKAPNGRNSSSIAFPFECLVVRSANPTI